MTSDTGQSLELRRMLMAFSKGDRERIRETLLNYSKADPRVSDIVSAVMEKFDSPAREVLAVLRRLYNEETEMTGEGRLVTASLAAHFGDPEFALEIMSRELRVNLIRVSRVWQVLRVYREILVKTDHLMILSSMELLILEAEKLR